MKVKKIIITKEEQTREVLFSDNINLIHSNENSKGKTTLLRALLYALGYNIPATDGIKSFDNFYITIVLATNKEEYILERHRDIIKLQQNEDIVRYILPAQINELHSVIFKINEELILNNLLATFYIDQEKGWTLLNRGIIIGKNRFKIEDFIAALSEKNVSSINNEIKKIEDELRKYRALKSISEYKEQNIDDDINLYSKKDESELYNKINFYKLRKLEVKNELKEINQILEDNKKIVTYLEKLDIYVKVSEKESIKVCKNNILNYSENQIFYETRRNNLEINLSKINNEIKKIEDELDSRNLFSNIQTVADEIDLMLKDVEINEKQMEKIIGQLTRRRQKLKDELHTILSENNIYLTSIFETIKKYAKELKFEEYIGDSPKFVLTDKLKGKTGRILTHMSFAFKLAYLTEIKKKYNIKLPIIIDSPKTNELTDDAAIAMIRILERDFKDHQIIYASIYDFKKVEKKVIEMKENLFY